MDKLNKEGIRAGLVDVFLLKPLNEDLLFKTLSAYSYVITLEEGFIGKGGLDSLISNILTDKESNIKLKRMGFGDTFVFDIGGRNYLHRIKNMGKDDVVKIVKNLIYRGER